MSPNRKAWLRRWGPGIAAWLVTCAVPAFFDDWAVNSDRPTQSRTLGHFLPNAIAGPVLFGVFCGLGYHLFVEELLAALGVIPGPVDRHRMIRKAATAA